ncbi:MAG: hypothetical protein Q8M03_16190 [Legionella sp.]|nr:hypothetical protein [Legionella sp.]
MTYEAPSYEKLVTKTASLKRDFVGRYSNPTYEETCRLISQLKKTYCTNKKDPASASWSSGFFPDKKDIRLEQIALIEQLGKRVKEGVTKQLIAEGLDGDFQRATDVETDTEEEKAKKKKEIEKKIEKKNAICEAANNTLLGALVHRRWRLILEHAWTGPDNCALKRTIDELLAINDKNPLDPLTISTFCEAYLNYLQKIENGKANYTEYSYIKTKIAKKYDFFGEIQETINNDEVRAGCVYISRLLSFVEFVQTIPPILTPYREKFMDMVAELKKLLTEKLVDEEEIGRDEVLEFLATIKPTRPELVDFIKEYILQPGIKVNESSLSLFIENITYRIDVYCRYALIGVYMMTLYECSDEDLHKTFYKAIKVDEHNSLDGAEIRNALKGLNCFIEKFPDFPGNSGFVGNMGPWGFGNNFKKKLEQRIQTFERPVEILTLKPDEETKIDEDRGSTSSCTA